MRTVAERVESRTLPGPEIPGSDLDDLLSQLNEIAARLSTVLRSQGSTRANGSTGYRLVADILHFRRQRDKIFGGNLFGEPVWDVLLELYAAEWTGRKLSISGACYVSGVPTSTALRWISRLERDGWIRRIEDPLDKRRSWLTLSDGTEQKMHQLLSQMAASSPFALTDRRWTGESLEGD